MAARSGARPPTGRLTLINPDPDPDPNLNPHLNPNPNPNQVAYWAAVTAPPGTYAQALIDSGGTMGPASAKTVWPSPYP